MSKSNQSTKNSLVPRILGAAVCFFITVLCWALLITVTVSLGTAATSPNGESVRSGQATATRCWSDGPFLIHLWEKCQLEVTWDDGARTTATSTYGEFTSEDIGQSAPVTLDEVGRGQGHADYETVTRDMDRPWAWLGWVLAFPIFLVSGLFLITGIIFLKPPKLDKKKRKGKPGKAPAKRQQ